MNDKLVNALAEYFAGPEVARHSVGLEVGGASADRATRFFDVRQALGISGYADLSEAKAAIRAALVAP